MTEAEPMDDIVDLSILTFNMHGQSVYSVAVHPSKPCLVLTGGGDDMGYLWSYKKSSSSNFVVAGTTEFGDHKDSVATVKFNFNGTLALTGITNIMYKIDQLAKFYLNLYILGDKYVGSFDGTVRIWNVDDGSIKHVLEGPEDIEWADWHSKGNAVVAGSNDGLLH